MYININCQIIIIIDWGEVSNMCGARCLIGRGEASTGARCPRGRDVNWGEMSGSPFKASVYLAKHPTSSNKRVQVKVAKFAGVVFKKLNNV